jgi:hypothetical protein
MSFNKEYSKQREEEVDNRDSAALDGNDVFDLEDENGV